MARDHYETLQQVFDDAYRGLAAQGFERSMRHRPNSGFTCAYRGFNGLKCAIGHCIPDELYSEQIEYLTPRSVEFNKTVNGLFNGVSRDRLVHLQMMHDESDSAEDMRRRLAGFAEIYGLTIPNLTA